jgi:Novel STAND NTPase 1/WD domain, G-beta repeat
LPALPERDLPDTPFRYLKSFREEDAEVFFGRGKEIRELYEMVTESSRAPIVFFFGQSGVGKSSLLSAGLVPRLRATHQVRYGRRERNRGLSGTLADLLNYAGGNGSLAEAWHAAEATSHQSVVVIIDQVEEVYTRPLPEEANELENFLNVLGEAFSDPSRRPRGKLVLSFRKDWLADLEDRLKQRRLPRSKLYLDRLGRAGIIEIIDGPARSKRLEQHYQLKIDDGLAELIADDLLADPRAPVAPTLQILLTRMWRQARASADGTRHFTIDQYQELERKGMHLDDFLTEQLALLRAWNTAVVDSGLALDLLEFHTTAVGTAEQRTRAELDAGYSHASTVLPELLRRCKDDLHLLADAVTPQESADKREGTRLAHDTLAPLVRWRFTKSDSPGQRARRILEGRAADWSDGKTANPLDESDLATALSGESGMRSWNEDERRLIDASRSARRKRQGLRFATAAASALLLLALGVLGLTQRRLSLIEKDRALLATAIGLTESDPTPAALLFSEITNLDRLGLPAIAGLRRAAELEVARVVLRGHRGWLNAALFSPDGSKIVTASNDSTARVWNSDGRGEPVVLRGHSARVYAASFSPDGSKIVTASLDNTARVWNADGRGEPVVLRGHGARVNAASFSPDGSKVVTTSEDNTARVWRVTWAGLHAFLRAATVACLSPAERVRTLAETDKKARRKYEACERNNGRIPEYNR